MRMLDNENKTSCKEKELSLSLITVSKLEIGKVYQKNHKA